MYSPGSRGIYIVPYYKKVNKLHKVSKKDFWEERYLTGKMPWDIGQAAPAFIKYFNYKGGFTSGKVCVLGCGLGHDAFYIANLKDYNLQVYGFDFSENAIKYCNNIKEKESLKNISFYQVDFFELLNDKNWKNYFDFVIEHTSLAAIDPNRRKEYVDLIKYLLKGGGKLIGLFFIRPKELGGPPYGIQVEEVRKLFKDGFIEVEKLHYEECLHKDKLTGDEYFGVCEKTG